MIDRNKGPDSQNNQPQSAEELAAFRAEVANEVANAERSIGSEYGRFAPREKRLAYHNEDHTFKDVLRRANILLNCIDTALRAAGKRGISERDMHLAQLIVAYHDKVMETTIEEQEDGSRIRRRPTTNELNSSIELLNYTGEANERLGKPIYTGEDRRLANSTILATVPTFLEGTVRQMELNKRSSLVTVAVAFADIGAAGMDGPEQLFKESSGLFFELNPDITERVLGGQLAGTESNLKESYKQRIILWYKSQEAFVRGRKERFHEELNFLPAEVHAAVGNVFNRFDDSIVFADSITTEFQKLPLEQIIDRMRPGLAIFYPESSDEKNV